MKYKAIYKCRLCGEQYEDAETGDDIAIMATLATAIEGFLPKECAMGIHLRNVHNCKDGSYGLSDFQGMKKED